MNSPTGSHAWPIWYLCNEMTSWADTWIAVDIVYQDFSEAAISDVFLYIQSKTCFFQFISITTHPLTKHHCEEPDSTTLMEKRCCPTDIGGYCQVLLKQFPLPARNSPAPSASLHTSVPANPDHDGPPLITSNLMIFPLNWGDLNETQYSRCGLTCAQQSQ